MFGKPLLIIALTVLAGKCDAAMMMGVPNEQNETASSNVTAMPANPDPNEQPGWSPPHANDTAAEGDSDTDEKPAEEHNDTVEQPGWSPPHANDTGAEGDSDTDEKPAEEHNDTVEQPGWSPPHANDTAAEGDSDTDEKPAEEHNDTVEQSEWWLPHANDTEDQPGWWFPQANNSAAEGDADNATSNTDEKPAEQPNEIIEPIPVFLDSEESNPEANNITTTEMVFYLTKSAGNMSEPNAEMPYNETVMETTVMPNETMMETTAMPSNETMMETTVMPNETTLDTTVTPVVTPSMTAGNISTGGLPIIV